MTTHRPEDATVWGAFEKKKGGGLHKRPIFTMPSEEQLRSYMSGAPYMLKSTDPEEVFVREMFFSWVEGRHMLPEHMDEKAEQAERPTKPYCRCAVPGDPDRSGYYTDAKIRQYWPCPGTEFLEKRAKRNQEKVQEMFDSKITEFTSRESAKTMLQLHQHDADQLRRHREHLSRYPDEEGSGSTSKKERRRRQREVRKKRQRVEG